ncbi:quinone oxidoreductase [Pedobacter chinensis]|uniref:Quinone oxidoreductase n=1 Tax=Pedobacter chinensis TaxID=2282421 RepID=A0A369PQZ4_9SPHI|nr:zinc-dependent alcohol dehydrogenase family protein [Pedobacter chinensis]RDC54690.1 quinone oxidoreductase [Pedobacter chinensis]
MKALILKQYNKPYIMEEIPIPIANERQVLVKISHSGVNPLDLKIKSGQAAHAQTKMPDAILGTDMSGVIVSVGNEVKNFKVGDAVYGMVGGIGGAQGTLAEYAAVDPDLLALKATNISFKEAAALPLITITAWEAMIDRADIQKGSTVLVHGGAGGVGHIAIQIARAKGAIVYTTVSSDQIETVRNLGAIPIDYTKYSVKEYITEFTNDEGFDVVLDTIGGTVLDASFTAVKRYTGHVISILGWGSHSLAPLSFRGASYSGVFTLYPLISGKHRKHHGKILTEVSKLIDTGDLKPLVDGNDYTMDSIDDAYKKMEDGSAQGKIIISIANNQDENLS